MLECSPLLPLPETIDNAPEDVLGDGASAGELAV